MGESGFSQRIITGMPNADAQLHIYQRTVDGSSRDSLSIIAGLIDPGQTILDLGMGPGGLGQYLSQRQPVVADGVSLNPAEAEIARTWYRQARVADLDRDDLTVLFAGQQYDCIVCADVLEHLKAPQNVLAQCKALLKPGGRLLTSVPNAGYCGLVAELIQGDFRYRPEGLLDSTHLRFFTRTSLQRFFAENAWATKTVMTTQRSLLESEFNVAFDSLAPAVARHLLAMPDALTYQFISVSQPAGAVDQTTPDFLETVCAANEAQGPAQALFSAQLYLAKQENFDEASKLIAAGRIGDPRQTLVFDITPSAVPYRRVRFDPADRPGFFRLHHLQIRQPNGQLIWQWQAGEDSQAILADALQHEMLVSSPWETSAGALLLLHGDDPWIELPLTSAQLLQISERGARLEVMAGWPMSADYLQASATFSATVSAAVSATSNMQAAHQQAVTALNQEIAHREQQIKEDALQRERLDRSVLDWQARAATLGQTMQEVHSEKQRLAVELHAAQRERNVFLAQFNQIAQHLQGIEQSTVFRVTRPLVRLKLRFDRLLGRSAGRSVMRPATVSTQPVPISKHAVDVIVPVFRGLEDTRLCLESVLASPCQTVWRLIVINDCSPEPEVTQWLRAFAQRDSRIELLENSENLGFVATVNRGMALSQDNDVLLLNSDAEVANDWLDRLQHAAYSGLRVASVTPFSNNATICSYPRFCKANELPEGYDTASLDRLFSEHLAGQAVEVPTGVGFCMYIRRQCLDEVGLFDVDNFGKGYGEENDFCVRAQEAGWTHLHALDTFVRHAGGISFGDTKSAREIQAMETLRRLHPRYEGDVHGFVQRDPASAARQIIDLARITGSGRPVVLNVMHDRQGGTLRHVQELAQHLGGKATFLRLTPASGGVELRLEGPQEGFSLHFALPHEQALLLETLQQLQVGHIHYHHLLGHAPNVADLPGQLGATHDFTAHDFFSYCPQISLTDYTDRYCTEQGLDQCRQCLQRNPAPHGESIESWRARHGRLLREARFVIAPSADTAQRMQRFVPTARVQVVPHATLALKPVQHPKPNPRQLPTGQPLKVVVLGALSKIKGADILEEVALLAARLDVPVEFHLLGYAYRSLRTQPKARLTVHGGYEEKDLPLLLEWLQPDVVWFPAVWPETYSYTLSASLDSGLPIIAPDIGAFCERLQQRDWTWLCDWRQSALQWVEFFGRIRRENFCEARGPGPIPAPQTSTAQEPYPGNLLMDYDSSYLDISSSSTDLGTEALKKLQQQVGRHQQNQNTVFKSVTLRALMRLRTSRALSPLARMVPTHLQRRVKSWLGT